MTVKRDEDGFPEPEFPTLGRGANPEAVFFGRGTGHVLLGHEEVAQPDEAASEAARKASSTDETSFAQPPEEPVELAGDIPWELRE